MNRPRHRRGVRANLAAFCVFLERLERLALAGAALRPADLRQMRRYAAAPAFDRRLQRLFGHLVDEGYQPLGLKLLAHRGGDNIVACDFRRAA